MKILKLLSLFFIAGLLFSSCQKDYELIDGISATGTLKKDASGDCMPVTVNGIYTANTVLAATNYIDLQVTIDEVGNYDIKTDTVNGYSFHGTGSVAVTGLNTIRLAGSGKPIIAGTDIFKVKFSGTSCEINVSVSAGGGGSGVPGTNSDSIVCKIDGIYRTFKINDTARYDDLSVTGYHVLNIEGESNAAGDDNFALGVGVPTGGSLTAGSTYVVNEYPAKFVGAAYASTPANSAYFVASGFGTAPAPLFTITITTISSTKVTGTFSGAIPDAFGVDPDINVQNGIFSVTIYP